MEINCFNLTLKIQHLNRFISFFIKLDYINRIKINKIEKPQQLEVSVTKITFIIFSVCSWQTGRSPVSVRSKYVNTSFWWRLEYYTTLTVPCRILSVAVYGLMLLQHDQSVCKFMFYWHLLSTVNVTSSWYVLSQLVTDHRTKSKYTDFVFIFQGQIFWKIYK